jgi:hypothetical protein
MRSSYLKRNFHFQERLMTTWGRLLSGMTLSDVSSAVTYYPESNGLGQEWTRARQKCPSGRI